ncbi:hypothetical protein J3459_018347 [Metarhizium acridum]|nr:hypothetical protein J3459_018347 [Metarhizium acridum]
MFGLACLAPALPFTAALPQSRPESQTPPFKADLRVDTNRDGTVDLSGTTDTDGEDTWSETSGAFSSQIKGIPDTIAGIMTSAMMLLQICSGHQNIWPRCATVPMPDIRDSATATIAISDPVARENVRSFLDYPGRIAEINFEYLDELPPVENDRWVYLENDTPIPADKLREGLTLCIDARDTRRTGGWIGEF